MRRGVCVLVLSAAWSAVSFVVVLLLGRVVSGRYPLLICCLFGCCTATLLCILFLNSVPFLFKAEGVAVVNALA